jgi:hypothetical protein
VPRGPPSSRQRDFQKTKKTARTAGPTAALDPPPPPAAAPTTGTTTTTPPLCRLPVPPPRRAAATTTLRRRRHHAAPHIHREEREVTPATGPERTHGEVAESRPRRRSSPARSVAVAGSFGLRRRCSPEVGHHVLPALFGGRIRHLDATSAQLPQHLWDKTGRR